MQNIVVCGLFASIRHIIVEFGSTADIGVTCDWSISCAVLFLSIHVKIFYWHVGDAG